MEATIVELRYKMRDVLKALERREKVRILYHGKIRGTIVPAAGGSGKKVKDHPFFGIVRQESAPVAVVMGRLRGPRY